MRRSFKKSGWLSRSVAQAPQVSRLVMHSQHLMHGMGLLLSAGEDQDAPAVQKALSDKHERPREGGSGHPDVEPTVALPLPRTVVLRGPCPRGRRRLPFGFMSQLITCCVTQISTLVVAEFRNQSLSGATLNTVGAARELGGEVTVLVAGDGGLQDAKQCCALTRQAEAGAS